MKISNNPGSFGDEFVKKQNLGANQNLGTNPMDVLQSGLIDQLNSGQSGGSQSNSSSQTISNRASSHNPRSNTMNFQGNENMNSEYTTKQGKNSKEIQKKLKDLFNYSIKYTDLKVRDVTFTVRTLEASDYLSSNFEFILADDFGPEMKLSDLMRKAYKYLVRALVKIVDSNGNEYSLEEIAGCNKEDPNYYTSLEKGLLENIPFVVLSDLILKYIEFYQEDITSQFPAHLLEKKS